MGTQTARPILRDDDRRARADASTRDLLSSRDAALYLSYTADRYKEPLEAFMAMVKRLGPTVLPKRYFGKRVFFYKRDLDRVLTASRKLRGDE